MNTQKITSVLPKVGCLLMCLSSTLSWAQEYNPPPPPPPAYNPPPNNQNGNYVQPSGYISINWGLANPEGSFANAVGSGYGGYAMPGDEFNLSLGIPINHSNFGVAFMFGSYDNQYDLNSYTNNNSEYPIYPDQNDYSETCLMGGLYVTYPMGIVSIDGRAMIGVLLSGLPEQDYGYNDAMGDSYEYDLQPSNSTSLAFDAGIGVRCLIGHFWRRPLCIMVNVDYFYSNVTYNTEQNIYEVPATGPNAGYQVQLIPSPVFSGSLPVELLNVSFGIGYQF